MFLPRRSRLPEVQRPPRGRYSKKTIAKAAPPKATPKVKAKAKAKVTSKAKAKAKVNSKAENPLPLAPIGSYSDGTPRLLTPRAAKKKK